MTTYTITVEQREQLLACVKAMYDYAGCRVHMQSYADQSADSLALLGKLQPNTQEPRADITFGGPKAREQMLNQLVQPAPQADYHTDHCYQGDYEGSCKYGDNDCTAAPQQKPLTDEQIQGIWNVASGSIPGWCRHITYARAIEAAHGVKP